MNSDIQKVEERQRMKVLDLPLPLNTDKIWEKPGAPSVDIICIVDAFDTYVFDTFLSHAKSAADCYPECFITIIDNQKEHGLKSRVHGRTVRYLRAKLPDSTHFSIIKEALPRTRGSHALILHPNHLIKPETVRILAGSIEDKTFITLGEDTILPIFVNKESFLWLDYRSHEGLIFSADVTHHGYMEMKSQMVIDTSPKSLPTLYDFIQLICLRNLRAFKRRVKTQCAQILSLFGTIKTRLKFSVNRLFLN